MRKIAMLLVTISFIFATLFGLTGFLINKNIIFLREGFYLLGDQEVTLNYGKKYEEKGFIAKLNGEDLQKKVVVTDDININKVGIYKINYILDLGYTKKELTRKIKIEDNTPPILTLSKNKIYLTKGEEFISPTYKAVDNYDGDVTNRVTVSHNINVNKTGTYKAIYTVSDTNGNSVEEELEVVVEDEFDHTYIKVSIKKQKLTYYVKHEKVFEADVVTGQSGATKTGDYKINKLVKGTVLATKNYRTYVNYWLGYSGNRYGIHDAPWRKKFGGNIYKTNGSHGCVNISTKDAKKLYQTVKVGTPVYIRR